MSLIDISPPITARTAVFPGDTPFSRTVSMNFSRGDSLELSAIHTTVHVGAHTDAPCHYREGGVGIAARPLELYYGPCQVVEVDVAKGARIIPGDVRVPIEAPRVLFRTGTFPDPERFDEDFASLSPELVAWLFDRGVRLVGIDTPSIDPCHDAVLHSHRAVAERDMGILEGIVLQHVPAGVYRLIALPLRLEGLDASPVRAVLETLG